jgi:Flp pilus assembly protein protease CpaA
MIIFTVIKLCILNILLIISTGSDIHKGRVGNKPVFAAIAIGFALNAAETAFNRIASIAYMPIFDALLGFALPFIILFSLFYIRALGAGDIKLLMAAGSLMGAGFVILTTMYAFLAGGLLALAVALRRRNFISGFHDLYAYIYICAAHRRFFPYHQKTASSAKNTITFTIPIFIGTAVSTLYIYILYHKH